MQNVIELPDTAPRDAHHDDKYPGTTDKMKLSIMNRLRRCTSICGDQYWKKLPRLKRVRQQTIHCDSDCANGERSVMETDQTGLQRIDPTAVDQSELLTIQSLKNIDTDYGKMSQGQGTMESAPPANSHCKSNGPSKHKQMPHDAAASSLGIQLRKTETERRVLVNGAGDCAPFNEHWNLAGRHLLEHTMIELRQQKESFHTAHLSPSGEKKKINTVNQRDAFAVAVATHVQKLAKDGDFDDDEENFGPGSRAVNALMKIMSGFNKGEKHNPELAKILINCAKTRTGRIGEHKHEFQAAIRAAQLHHVKEDGSSETGGGVLWTLPVVHMLSHHMIGLGLPGISFKPTKTEDKDIAKPIRMQCGKEIWIKVNSADTSDDAPKKKIVIESRDDVRQKLIEVCTNQFQANVGPCPTEEAAPPLEEQRPSKRGRRSLGDE